MRDPSPYTGKTVRLKRGGSEFGGLEAEVEDWFVNVDTDGRSWRQADFDGDPKAQGYQVRRGSAGVPDDDEVLMARVDGIRQLIHVSEIEGAQPATFPTAAAGRIGPQLVDDRAVGLPCPGCGEDLARGDFVAQIVLGPGKDPEAREAARNGRPYQAVVDELHWACATGQEDVSIPRESIPDLMEAHGLTDPMQQEG